jgi:hypothetical protein
VSNVKDYFGAFVSFSLLVASILLKSPAFAWASVGSLLVALVAEVVHEKLFAMKNISIQIPEDVRKKMQETEARLTSIEYGIKQRGY